MKFKLSILLFALLMLSASDSYGQQDKSTTSNSEELDTSGNGIHGRKVTKVDRTELSKVMASVDAGEMKHVWIITCINIQGKVTYAEIDEANSNITNVTTLKQILQIVHNYKFEADLDAPGSQCGVVKFKIDKTMSIDTELNRLENKKLKLEKKQLRKERRQMKKEQKMNK